MVESFFHSLKTELIFGEDFDPDLGVFTGVKSVTARAGTENQCAVESAAFGEIANGCVDKRPGGLVWQTHLLSLNRDRVHNIPWVYERIEGYVYSPLLNSAPPGSQKIHHLYNNVTGDRDFTTNGDERVEILAISPDWKDQTPLGYGPILK